MASHIVGYPRMGPKRELKFALESFWDKKSSAEDLEKVAADLRASIWKQMSEAGIKYIPSNTFSYYDQVLDTTAMLGAVPDRYSWTGGEIGHDTYFSMARGNATVPAMEMTKWFDTNYHFIVPELGPQTKFSYASHKAVSEYKEAKALGVDTVPVLVGPVSYLLLSKAAKGVEKSFSLLSLLGSILPIYKEVVAELKAAGASWIQFDEPTLVKDLAAHELAAFSSAYAELESSLSGLNVLVETYFADVPAESYKTLTSLCGVTAYGFDLVRGTKTLDLVKSALAGPAVMALFAFVIFFTSNLLADCYRTGDLATGRRNYTYMDAVRANLGGAKVKVCGAIQYLNLFGVAVGYTIAASISMMAIKRSNCFHASGGKDPCHMSSNMYMIIFGIVQVFFSQIPDFDQVWWLSIVAAIMSFTYSIVGLSLGIAQVAQNKAFQGSIMGISVGAVTKAGTVTPMQKIWRNLQALGDIAFAYSYSIILIEIQDTLRSPPPETRTMRKATLVSISITTAFYLLCGCAGYAAFGDDAPGNLLTGFGFYNPYWLLDIANLAIVVHLVGAYQVYSQPLFAFVEKWAARRWPKVEEYDLRLHGPNGHACRVNAFRLVWRTCFVVLTTIVSMLLPFFNDVVGILGALGFWPLTVYFPVEMYIAHRKIRRWSTPWVGLQALSLACLVVSLAAAVGSIAGVVLDLKSYHPFRSTY